MPSCLDRHNGKKIAGRKRSIITDTLGPLLAVLVTAAGLSDSAVGLPLLRQVAAAQPTLVKAWADSAYRTTLIEGAAALGIDLEVVARDPATRGFTPLPRRWVAERTFGRLMLHRRLTCYYETRPDHAEAMVHIAMIDLMARRLTGENTPPGARLAAILLSRKNGFTRASAVPDGESRIGVP